MTGPNNDQLIQYQNKIKRLAQSCSSKLHLTEETDMDDWSQETVEKYYDYCLQRRVIPTIDIQNSTLHLIGPKDAVNEVEKYFLQLTAEILRNAYTPVLSCGYIWSVEISSGKWTQYSYRINKLIENAYLKKLSHYAAHRDEYTQSDERLLFHGCCSISADKIVQECFNRAFAGLHGVLYGKGVYFHEHTAYSNKYAKLNSKKERTMFLARVLIGKTCIGKSLMKVPPEGFDTTTDGRHIFVIYHDAGAYGEYLITYK
ncbi:unnamed protein product [Rotaria sp. Silwood1]|nr:unnamed protein product [Rotaria sp. Silwood1]CAF3864316.1 unnamed protein product [Rotaria sp. Silwood1]